MSCSTKTHVLRIQRPSGQRTWHNLVTGQAETDAATIARLEAQLLEEECLPANTECRESQEWTYGIDNTGTRFDDVATYELTLSDGSTLQWSQDGTSTSWTPQLIEWSNNIQQAADDAGLAWFVEPRAVDSANPSNIDGTYNGPGGTPFGLPGAPSVPIALALDAGGMQWRYVNFQICPGQPVPVSAVRLTSSLYGDGEYDLTAAGPVLGPIAKFKVCVECGESADQWYVLDDVASDGTYREANAGEIPNCWEPCGVLSQLPPPPSQDCQFEIDVACDNNNSANTVDFTNTITRRAKICNGEQIAVDYFEADPLDASALIPYTLVGDFVDCATGEPVPVPEPECGEAPYIGLLWKLVGVGEPESTVDWWAPNTFPPGSNAAPHDDVSNIFSVVGGTLQHVNGAPDVSYVSPTFDTGGTSGPLFLANVGAASSAETSGTDQIRISGYIVLRSPALLRDSNTNTGERGGIWVNECCDGDLELLQERTTDTVGGDTGVFDGVRLPAGIHYIEAVTSDLSSWQGLQLSVSFDDGATYEPFVSYSSKPSYECLPVLRCSNSGKLINAETGEGITVDQFDTWCEPQGCGGCCGSEPASSGGGASAQDIADAIAAIPEVDASLTRVSGTGSIPAGLKSVTINNITGVTTIDGTFELGTGRRVDSISFGTDRGNDINELLPAYTLAGGTWQWIGHQ